MSRKKNDKEKEEIVNPRHQLFILSRLRNLEKPFTKILEDMPITFEVDVEKDYLYKRGKEKGKEELRQKLLKKEKEFKEQILKKEEELREKAKKNEAQTIIGFYNVGNDIKTIAKALNITQKKVKQVIEEWKNKK